MHFYILSHQERMENVQAIQERLLGLGHRVTIVPVSSASHKDAWALVAEAEAEEPQETHIILEDNIGLSGNLEPINPLLAYDAVIMWRHPSYLHIPVVQVSESPGYLEYYEQKGMYAYALTPLFAKELIEEPLEPLEPLEIYLGKLGKKVYISEQSPFFIWGHLCDDFFSTHSSSSSSL